MASKLLWAGLLLSAAIVRMPAFGDTVQIDFSGYIAQAGFGVPAGEPFTGSAFYTVSDSPAYSWPCSAGTCTAAYAIPQSFTFTVDGSTVYSSDFAFGNNDIYVQYGQSGSDP